MPPKPSGEMSLSPDGSLVLVHQLIRQYVMAKILVDLTKTGKEVVVFVVGVNENRAAGSIHDQTGLDEGEQCTVVERHQTAGLAVCGIAGVRYECAFRRRGQHTGV